MHSRRIRVVSYAGYRGDERPQAFFPEEQKIDVFGVISTWTGEGVGRERKRFFKVKGSDGFTYTLSCNEMSEWFLE